MDWARSGLISAQYGARNDPLPDHDGTGLIEGTILVCFQPIISPGQKWDKKWASLWPDIGARPCQIWPVFCPCSGLEMGWDWAAIGIYLALYLALVETRIGCRMEHDRKDLRASFRPGGGSSKAMDERKDIHRGSFF